VHHEENGQCGQQFRQSKDKRVMRKYSRGVFLLIDYYREVGLQEGGIELDGVERKEEETAQEDQGAETAHGNEADGQSASSCQGGAEERYQYWTKVGQKAKEDEVDDGKSAPDQGLEDVERNYGREKPGSDE